MSRFNTGNPLGSGSPLDLDDNAKNMDVLTNSKEAISNPDRFGVQRKTWYGIESEFEQAQSDRDTSFSESQSARAAEFYNDQEYRRDTYLALMNSLGYQELGAYEDGPYTITALSQVVTVGEYSYRIGRNVEMPYDTQGVTPESWEAERHNFMQINFVTAAGLDRERAARQAADANLQAQISDGAPLAASAFSPLSWHAQEISNSVTIPDNVNAWSFGPVMTIADGQSITIGDNSFWTIANGMVSQ